MAALGYIMIGGMVGGAFANTVMDTMNVTKNCDMAKKMIKSMEKMQKFYDGISDQNTRNQAECQILIDNMKTEHDQHKLVIDDYLKNNNDRIRRTEIVLVTSLSIIIVNFIIKANILQNAYDYFFSKK